MDIINASEYSADQLDPRSLIEDTKQDYHFKSHDLIFSGSDLSAKMMDILALMLNKMHYDDWLLWQEDKSNEPIYTFSNQELSEWFGIPAKQLSSRLFKPTKDIANKAITFEVRSDSARGKERAYKHLPLVSDIEYENGVLTIKPNTSLFELYLVNYEQSEGGGSKFLPNDPKRGFGLIYNDIFLKLGNPNSKRVFEMLSRFREKGFDMYFHDVEQLQIYFGVLDGNRNVKKKAYKSEKTFITRIIKPALEEIGKIKEASERFTINCSTTGSYGYEVEKNSKGKLKLKFLVEWHDELKTEEVSGTTNALMAAMADLQTAKTNGDRLIPYLEKVTGLLKALGYEEEYQLYNAKLQEKIQTEQDELRTKTNRASTTQQDLLKTALSNFNLADL